ncbi:DUF1700 domain-containing protein [Lachnospiraceae bacterium 62-35]
MNKTEFLQCLEYRLKILNEKEREDILNEYEQHIQMRMKGGLTEEEAIKDFGDLEELLAEILDAYNVNPEYGRQKGFPIGKLRGKLAGGSASLGNGIRALCSGIICLVAAAGRKMYFGVRAVLLWCITLVFWPFQWKKRKREEEELESGAAMDGESAEIGQEEKNLLKEERKAEEKYLPAVKEAEEEKSGEKKENRTAAERRSKRAEIRKRRDRAKESRPAGWKKAIQALWGSFWYACLWSGLLFIKGMILVMISPIILAELMAVAGLGLLLVLMFMGYPVIGLIMIVIGCLICGFILLWLTKEILFLKVGKREDRKEKMPQGIPEKGVYET